MGQIKTGLDTLYNKNLIHERVFGFYVTLNHGGALILGPSPEYSYVGAMNLVPLSPPHNMWQIEMNGILVYGHFSACRKQCQAIIETATNHIAGPATVIKKINEKTLGGILEKGGLYTVDCDRIENLPEINFRINSIDYPISPRVYILQVSTRGSVDFRGEKANKNFYYSQHPKTKNRMRYCTSLFMDLPNLWANTASWVLGTPIMSGRIFSFNKDKRHIGIAIAPEQSYPDLVASNSE